MSDPVRLALVGCGRIAQVAHLPAVEKAEGVELVAVCDPSAAVAGSVAGRYCLSAAYTDQGSLWGDGSVDIEVLGASGAVRVDLHFPFSRRAATVRAYRDGAAMRLIEATATAVETGSEVRL
jgi:predicted dehydrogenase